MILQHIAKNVAGLIERFLGKHNRSETALFSYMPRWPGCGAEREMKRLVKLSCSTASREPDGSVDGAAHACSCTSTSQSRGSYHSRMLYHDASVSTEDGAPGTLNCAWLIDFAKDENFRVTEVTSGGASYNDYDRTATIGD